MIRFNLDYVCLCSGPHFQIKRFTRGSILVPDGPLKKCKKFVVQRHFTLVPKHPTHAKKVNQTSVSDDAVGENFHIRVGVGSKNIRSTFRAYKVDDRRRSCWITVGCDP